VLVASWSGRPAEGESAALISSLQLGKASGYVGKLNLVWCWDFKFGFQLSLRYNRRLLSEGHFGVVVSAQGEEYLGQAAPRYLWVSFSYLLYESSICLIRVCSFMYIELDILMQPRDTACGVYT
jgi:hypothetical protein